MFEPVYLRTRNAGRLAGKVERALAELERCLACPRRCGVNRLEGRTAACYTGRHAYVSSAFAHFGEEDCLRGSRGSGTIFFARCNLRCVFCQNRDISQDKAGREVDARELARLMLQLQARGCHNINLVTPEHVAPQIVEALPHAIAGGLRVPLVYNTSAYDAPESLALMEGLVDIYMPDFKFWSPETAFRYMRARDYPQAARRAIAEMHRQVGELQTGSDGLARRGLIVRHLVMPGLLGETRAILEWIATRLSRSTCVNLMHQYFPAHRAGRHPEIARPLYPREFAAARTLAGAAGLTRLDERLERRASWM